jgi:hypothetical protein
MHRVRASPSSYIKPYDKARDRTARRILARFQKAQDYLARVKTETLADINALREDGKAGNFQFQSFDGLIRVRLDARTVVEFDDRFNQAQALIFEYLDDLTKASVQADIVALVRAAFAPTSGGMLSRAKVMSLFRISIKAEKWLRAMNLLKECQLVKSGRSYIYCETRPDIGADYDTILLDFAAIDPAADEAAPTLDSPAPPPSE